MTGGERALFVVAGGSWGVHVKTTGLACTAPTTWCTQVVHAGGASSRVHGSLVRLKHVCIIGNHYITVMSDSKIKIYKVYNIIGRATRHYLAAVPCAHGRSTGFHQRPPVGRAYCQTRVKQ